MDRKLGADTRSQPEVVVEFEDRVGVISLNRPRVHNALNIAMVDALAEAFQLVQAERQVNVVLLRGEGPSFCSGRDLAELGERREGQSHTDMLELVQGMRKQQNEVSKPIIAALHGHVIGAGLEIALGADMRLATADTVLRAPEVTYGLTTDLGLSFELPTLVGPSRAKWMIMSGAKVTAREAADWGLVDWVTADKASLDAKALEMSAQLASLPPLAVQAGKRLVDQVWRGGLIEGLNREADTQCLLFESDDYLRIKRARSKARTMGKD